MKLTTKAGYRIRLALSPAAALAGFAALLVATIVGITTLAIQKVRARA